MTSPNPLWTAGQTRVLTVNDVDLRVVDGAWPFAIENESDITRHWERRRREAAGFFNGTVYALAAFSVSEGGVLAGRLVRTDFKSSLYWRETGWRDTSVMDAFSTALIFSAEGHILLGRQRAGHLNAGLCYPPSGFIDAADVAADGSIDLEASAAREAKEEAGLLPEHLARAAGFMVTMVDGLMSIGVPYRSSLSGTALLAAAGRHIADDPQSEIAEFLLVRPGTAHDLPMPRYTRALLAHIAAVKISG